MSSKYYIDSDLFQLSQENETNNSTDSASIDNGSTSSDELTDDSDSEITSNISDSRADSEIIDGRAVAESPKCVKYIVLPVYSTSIVLYE